MKKGQLASGWEHYVLYGFHESRPGTPEAGGGKVGLLTGAELVPPRNLIDLVGPGGPDAYRRIGAEFLSHFKSLAHLQPNERILDVGCGCGRIAVALTRYLDAEGSYEGFDIVADLVAWCQQNIAPRFPNFKFHHVLLRNDAYGQKGPSASEYGFPYQDSSFDFVFLTSVFTHMFPHDMENYTREISRVLRKGGRTLITFFLLTPESIRCMGGSSSLFSFKYAHPSGCWCTDEKNPEGALAYPETTVRNLFGRHGLNITEVRYGSWSGRAGGFSSQDITISLKQ